MHRSFLCFILSIPSLFPAQLAAADVLALRSSKPAYNLGETVELLVERRATGGPEQTSGGSLRAAIRFAGGALVRTVELEPGKWTQVWHIPQDAALGLYEVEITREAKTGASSGGNQPGSSLKLPHGLVVYRQDLAIESVRTERSLYTAGDTVRVKVRMKNIGARVLSDLKIVIGRGYPWISGFGRGSAISGEPSAQVYYYPKAITLRPGETVESDWFDTMKAATPSPDKADIFNMFCWVSDSSGRDLYDLELTGTFVVEPPGYTGSLPYHPLYALNKSLSETDYRGACYKPIEAYDDNLPAGNPKLRSWMAFAPHYDDEMSFFPLVPPSQKEHVPFHIVQMTAGDGNVDSIHRYVDGVSNAPDWHTLGRLRHLETVHAAAIFGLQDGSDYSHLGLPDGGLLPIFEDTSGKNFYMFTAATDHTPYDFVVKKNLAYNREEIIKLLADMIRRRRPEDIYAPHPDEGHGDHRTTTWLVLEALRRLRAESGYEPQVHVYVAYGAGDFPKAKYRYEAEPPLQMSDRTLVKLHFASWAYQSQFSIAERGGKRESLEELRRHRASQWYLLKGW
jgi:LmbE family N-acetylglucosaminyl deacetylase